MAAVAAKLPVHRMPPAQMRPRRRRGAELGLSGACECRLWRGLTRLPCRLEPRDTAFWWASDVGRLLPPGYRATLPEAGCCSDQLRIRFGSGSDHVRISI